MEFTVSPIKYKAVLLKSSAFDLVGKADYLPQKGLVIATQKNLLFEVEIF